MGFWMLQINGKMHGYSAFILAGLLVLSQAQTQTKTVSDIANKFTAHLPVDIRCKTDIFNKLSCGVHFQDQCAEKWKFPNPCTPENLANNLTMFPHPNRKANNKFLMCGDFGKLYVVLCPRYEVFHAGCRQCVAQGSKLTPKCEVHDMPLTPPSANPCTPSAIAAGNLFFPFPGDLGKYIHCDAWGKAWEMICTPGEVWDLYKVACVNPIHFNPCVQSLRNKGHLYKHPCNPTMYIRCGKGFLPYEVPCTAGDIFSEANQVCQPASHYQVLPQNICGGYRFGFRSYSKTAFTVEPGQQHVTSVHSTGGTDMKVGSEFSSIMNSWQEAMKPGARGTDSAAAYIGGAINSLDIGNTLSKRGIDKSMTGSNHFVDVGVHSAAPGTTSGGATNAAANQAAVYDTASVTDIMTEPTNVLISPNTQYVSPTSNTIAGVFESIYPDSTVGSTGNTGGLSDMSVSMSAGSAGSLSGVDALTKTVTNMMEKPPTISGVEFASKHSYDPIVKAESFGSSSGMASTTGDVTYTDIGSTQSANAFDAAISTQTSSSSGIGTNLQTSGASDIYADQGTGGGIYADQVGGGATDASSGKSFLSDMVTYMHTGAGAADGIYLDQVAGAVTDMQTSGGASAASGIYPDHGTVAGKDILTIGGASAAGDMYLGHGTVAGKVMQTGGGAGAAGDMFLGHGTVAGKDMQTGRGAGGTSVIHLDNVAGAGTEKHTGGGAGAVDGIYQDHVAAGSKGTAFDSASSVSFANGMVTDSHTGGGPGGIYPEQVAGGVNDKASRSTISMTSVSSGMDTGMQTGGGALAIYPDKGVGVANDIAFSSKSGVYDTVGGKAGAAADAVGADAIYQDQVAGVGGMTLISKSSNTISSRGPVFDVTTGGGTGGDGIYADKKTGAGTDVSGGPGFDMKTGGVADAIYADQVAGADGMAFVSTSSNTISSGGPGLDMKTGGGAGVGGIYADRRTGAGSDFHAGAGPGPAGIYQDQVAGGVDGMTLISKSSNTISSGAPVFDMTTGGGPGGDGIYADKKTGAGTDVSGGPGFDMKTGGVADAIYADQVAGADGMAFISTSSHTISSGGPGLDMKTSGGADVGGIYADRGTVAGSDLHAGAVPGPAGIYQDQVAGGVDGMTLISKSSNTISSGAPVFDMTTGGGPGGDGIYADKKTGAGTDVSGGPGFDMKTGGVADAIYADQVAGADGMAFISTSSHTISSGGPGLDMKTSGGADVGGIYADRRTGAGSDLHAGAGPGPAGIYQDHVAGGAKDMAGDMTYIGSGTKTNLGHEFGTETFSNIGDMSYTESVGTGSFSVKAGDMGPFGSGIASTNVAGELSTETASNTGDMIYAGSVGGSSGHGAGSKTASLSLTEFKAVGSSGTGGKTGSVGGTGTSGLGSTVDHGIEGTTYLQTDGTLVTNMLGHSDMSVTGMKTNRGGGSDSSTGFVREVILMGSKVGGQLVGANAVDPDRHKLYAYDDTRPMTPPCTPENGLKGWKLFRMKGTGASHSFIKCTKDFRMQVERCPGGQIIDVVSEVCV